MTDARKQQSHSEWEHQANHSTVNVFGIADETTIDRVLEISIDEVAP